MIIETTFSPGDKVFVVQQYDFQEVTIGQVTSVEITDTPGIDGEIIFDNYKAQKGRKEEYMCVETGIGSGSVWAPGENLFRTKEEAEILAQKNRDARDERILILDVENKNRIHSAIRDAKNSLEHWQNKLAAVKAEQKKRDAIAKEEKQ